MLSRERDARGLVRTLEARDATISALEAELLKKGEALQTALAQVETLKAEVAQMEVLKARVADLERSASEAEASRLKAESDLQAAKAESEAQYTKGYNAAGDAYEDQLRGLIDRIFREGWRAALRKQTLAKSSSYWSEIPTRDEADLGSDDEAEGANNEPKDADLPPPEATDAPNA